MKLLSLVIIIFSAFFSCTNSIKEGTENRLDSGGIFYEYKVSGEEGNDSVTVLLHYRVGNEDDLPTILDSGSKVTLDGREMGPDSARLTGTFYEIILPAKEFEGTHTIVFMGSDGNNHRQEFSFLPFSIANELPPEIKKDPFVIKLNGFGKEPVRVQLVMIDTAFNTKDVNEELLVKNGEFTITAKMWRALSAGPITMEIYREEETSFDTGGKETGKLVKTYKLKREFETVEN